MTKERQITFVLPNSTTMVGSTEIVKNDYLQERIKSVQGIKIVETDNIEYDGKNLGHPTENGTAEMLKQIDAAVGGIILQKAVVEDLTTHMKYRNVQPAHKVGCKGCSSY